MTDSEMPVESGLDLGNGGKFLERDLALAITSEVRIVGRRVLREVIDEGLGVFARCSKTAQGEEENVAVLFPFLHLLEMLDGTEVLLDGAAVNPAYPVLRAAFESLLSVEWVTKDLSPDESRRRSRAFVVVDIHRKIQLINRYDTAHPDHAQFAAEIQKDDAGSRILMPKVRGSSSRRAGLKAMLQSPALREAAAEYEATRARLKKRWPPYYACWGGPSDIEQLARHLGRGGQYQVLYRRWASESHGDVLNRQLTTFDGETAIHRFRSGQALDGTYSLALTIGLAAIRTVLGRYRPEEIEGPHPRWYESKIRQDYVALFPTGKRGGDGCQWLGMTGRGTPLKRIPPARVSLGLGLEERGYPLSQTTG